MMAAMFLLRVVLPDRPGSLGALATALGKVDADIISLDVVEHSGDGSAIDDILVELPHGKLPDTVVSACQSVEGVRVQFLRRYPAGADLHRDLQAIEAMTRIPDQAGDMLVDLAPGIFRADWALLLERSPDGVDALRVSSAGPEVEGVRAPWLPLARPRRLSQVGAWAPHWRDTAVAAAPFGDPERALLVGRRGGPEFLDSELARLGHLVALAETIRSASD
jgi:hypothetical protein